MGPWVLLFWLQFGIVFCQNTFPNPQKEWRMCGRSKPSFICDPDFILERGDAEKLDQIANEFRKSTSCFCPKCTDNIGVSLGIFIKHNVSKEVTEKYPTGKEVSEMLRRRWSLSTCDNDIVIVLLTQQNISDFSLGPAVGKIFPLETASQIVQECRVHFESGWYYQGLESIANSFNDVLIKLQKQSTPVFKNLLLGIGLGFGVLFILALTAIITMHRQSKIRKKSYCSDIYEGIPTTNNRRKTSPNREEHLERLKRLNSDEEDDTSSTQYTQYMYTPPKDTLSTMHFMRMQRQLSDVAEESSEDMEVLKQYGTSFGSNPLQKGNIPVTEL